MSSLLVRDGLVGVKRMEKAFQRQVIYGGSLDTILLEMNLVPEERLSQYLALASGLPPAARDEGQFVDDTVSNLITRELAAKYRTVPLAIDGDTVRVLVCPPLELAELEDLADLLDRPLQPLITPEYRWHLVYAATYGLDAPARFTTLARQLDEDPANAPVGRARSVIIDEPSSGLSSSTRGIATSEPLPILRETTDRTLIPTRPPATATPPGVPLQRAPDAATAPFPGLSATPPGAEADLHAITRNRAATLMGMSNPTTGPIPLLTQSQSGPIPTMISTSNSKRSQTVPIPTEGRDSPMPVVRAREVLATAEDRDSVFLTLLRAARSRARWAGLLTVQGGAAIGRVALGEPGLDVAAVTTVLIPLDVLSPFRTVISNNQPHIGPLTSGDPAIDAMLLRLGGTVPPSALLLPIVLRDRSVAIVVAHRVHSDIRLADVTELLPIATAASDALGRLIVRHKAVGYRAPSDAPEVPIETDHIHTKRIQRIHDHEWKRPDVAPPTPSFDAQPSGRVPVIRRPIEDVISDIERAKEGFAEEAMNEAVERASETLGVVMRRFPGKLRVERFHVTGRPLRAAQYGGLLELVIRLGSISSELLIDKMSAPQRDIRFYATVCCTELRPRNAVYALAERLFDQDFGVRACAIEALAGYPVHDLGHALLRARRAVHSTDPEVVGAAAAAIVELGDVDAIADLIGVIERQDRAGEHARRALVALTAQDFGPNEKKWRKWHETARGRHRIEWLIDGLSHKEDAVREASINELRRLTGEYFGYHHDLPRRERDLAAERWAQWWRETGQRRFGQREEERNRPTAQLPRRD